MEKSTDNFRRLYYKAAIWLFMFAAVFQNICLIQLPNGLNIYPFHLTAILFLPVFFPVRRYKLPPWPLLLLLGILIITTLLNASDVGITSTILSYGLGAYYCTAFLNLPTKTENDEREYIQLLQSVLLILAAALVVKMLVFRPEILTFSQSGRFHPAIYCFFHGGCNLEASWTALFGVFFWKKPRTAAVYMAVAWVISILYASRAGVIACTMVTLWLLIHCRNKAYSIGRIVISLTLTVAVSIGFLFVYWKLPIAGLALDEEMSTSAESIEEPNWMENMRLDTVGSDPGSRGRLMMWKLVPQAFLDRPQGYGAGNAVKAIERVSGGIDFAEDNIHNLVLQFLLDGGALGAIVFVAISAVFGIVQLRDHLAKDPRAAFLAFFIILGMIQFQGPEICMFLVLALYLARKREMIQKGA